MRAPGVTPKVPGGKPKTFLSWNIWVGLQFFLNVLIEGTQSKKFENPCSKVKDLDVIGCEWMDGQQKLFHGGTD